MKKIFTATLVVLFSYSVAFAQKAKKSLAMFQPQNIEATIGQKYILLPVDSNKKDFGIYLHVYPNPSADNLVPAVEGGKTIVTLQSITSGAHAMLIDDSGVIYNQYFKNGEDELLYFTPLADYENARRYIGKLFWLKSNMKKVKITDVHLTPDHNAPLLIIYQYRNGKRASVSVVLSGTNSRIDKSILFNNIFYASKP